MVNKVEKRSLEQVNVLEDNIVEGYALKFNKESRDLGGFIEVIDKTALDNVDLSDVRCFLDHDSSKLLGRTKSGTLELNVDDVGLHFRCSLPNTTVGRDALELVKRGDLSQCSFMFTTNKDGTKWTRGDVYKRTVTSIKDIFEISLVSIPAYNDTDVSVAKRALENVKNELDKDKLSIQLDILSMQ